MKVDVGGFIQALNPAYQIMASNPKDAHPGTVLIEMTFSFQPPLLMRLYFDRNAGEELLNNFRAALDTAKGLKCNGAA